MNNNLNNGKKESFTVEALEKELREIPGVKLILEQELLEKDFREICGFSEAEARQAAINVIQIENIEYEEL